MLRRMPLGAALALLFVVFPAFGQTTEQLQAEISRLRQRLAALRQARTTALQRLETARQLRLNALRMKIPGRLSEHQADFSRLVRRLREQQQMGLVHRVRAARMNARLRGVGAAPVLSPVILDRTSRHLHGAINRARFNADLRKPIQRMRMIGNPAIHLGRVRMFGNPAVVAPWGGGALPRAAVPTPAAVQRQIGLRP